MAVATAASLTERYPELEAIQDPVEFSRRVLGFYPYSYQAPIVASPLHELNGSLIKAGRRSGKTEALAAWAVVWPTRQPMNVYALAPSERQSKWLREKVRRFVYATNYLPLMKAIQTEVGASGDWIIRDNDEELRFANGSTVVTLPCPPDAKTLRGMGFDSGRGLIILDEAAQIPEFVQAIVRASTLGTDSSVCHVSTPRGEQGTFYDTYRFMKGREGYRIFEWSCWDAVKAGQMTGEEVEAERALLSATLFSQELEGEFVSGYGRVFDRDSIEACADGQPEPARPDCRYILSLDCGYELDPAVGQIWRVSEDFQSLWLVDSVGFINSKVQKDDPKYASYRGVSSYLPIRDWILSAARRYRLLCCLLDTTNQSALADCLRSDHRLPIEKMKFSRTSKPMYIQDLSAALRAGRIHFWRGSELQKQLEVYAYEMEEGKMRLTTERDNDHVDSAALAANWLQRTGAAIKPQTFSVRGTKPSIWGEAKLRVACR